MTLTQSVSRLAVHATRCVAPAVALAAALASPAVLAEKSDKDFQAEIATHETIAPNPSRCPTAPLAGMTTGRGYASKLGAVALVASDCITPQMDGTFSFADGRFTLTDAKGQTVSATYATSAPGTLSPTAVPGVYTLSTSYVVTGGSGKYSGATGSGTLLGTVNIATGAGLYFASGTLAY